MILRGRTAATLVSPLPEPRRLFLTGETLEIFRHVSSAPDIDNGELTPQLPHRRCPPWRDDEMEGRGDRKVDSLLDALSCRGLAEQRLATVAFRRCQNGSKEDTYAGEGWQDWERWSHFPYGHG